MCCRSFARWSSPSGVRVVEADALRAGWGELLGDGGP